MKLSPLSLFQKVRPLFLLPLALFLTACIPSENPLGAPGKIDERLLGVWKDNGGAVLTFRAEKDGWMAVNRSAGSCFTGTAFAVEAAGTRFLNFVVENSDTGKKFYVITRYEISADGKLTFWYLDEKLIAAAIQSGKLKGTVPKKNQTKNELTLSEPSESLLRFVEKNGADKVFTEMDAPFLKTSE